MSAAGPVYGAATPIVRVLPHLTVAVASDAADVVRLGDLVEPKAAVASAAATAARTAATTNFLILALLLDAFRYGMRRRSGSFVCLVRPRGRVPGRMKGRNDLHRAVAAV